MALKDDIQLPHRKYKCRKCWNEYTKLSQCKKAMTIEGYFNLTMNDIKNNSRRKKYGCDIDADYLTKLYELQNGRCAISGIEMTVGYEKYMDNNSFRNLYNISVDRIDSEKGYTKDNVIFICGCIN